MFKLKVISLKYEATVFQSFRKCWKLRVDWLPNLEILIKRVQYCTLYSTVKAFYLLYKQIYSPSPDIPENKRNVNFNEPQKYIIFKFTYIRFSKINVLKLSLDGLIRYLAWTDKNSESNV